MNFEEAKTKLVGTKIYIQVETHIHTHTGGEYRTYKVHDPVKVREIEAAFPGQTVRLMTPGSMWTSDVRRDRINVSIAEDGTISRIYEG